MFLNTFSTNSLRGETEFTCMGVADECQLRMRRRKSATTESGDDSTRPRITGRFPEHIGFRLAFSSASATRKSAHKECWIEITKYMRDRGQWEDTFRSFLASLQPSGWMFNPARQIWAAETRTIVRCLCVLCPQETCCNFTSSRGLAGL